MKLAEMQAIAADTLVFFTRIMPDAPFTADDIVVEFAPRTKMAERTRALCALYAPGKIINESQAQELNQTITANALIGREKSAVIARINHKLSEQVWREIFFHEFTHIFCAKNEVDGDHFIDVYGSGTTPDNPNMTALEKTYDGFLVAGHTVWSEFIAQYYTSGYLGAQKRENAIVRNKHGKKIRYKINRRPSQSKNNTARSKAQIKRREREKSSVRSKVEHVFGVVKGLFGFRKTRYKGRRKQDAKLHMLFALANLILADRPCLVV